MSQATQPRANPDALPVHSFDESIGLDDPKPFPSWEPSPAQIEEWSAIIRDEREAMKMEDIDSED
jgi:hypothetical protein